MREERPATENQVSLMREVGSHMHGGSTHTPALLGFKAHGQHILTRLFVLTNVILRKALYPTSGFLSNGTGRGVRVFASVVCPKSFRNP